MLKPIFHATPWILVVLVAVALVGLSKYDILDKEDTKLFVTVAAFAITTLFLVKNYRNGVRSNSAKMVADFSNRLDSSDMRKYRKRLAGELLKAQEPAKPATEGGDVPTKVCLGDDIPFLDFIEDVGYLTRSGVLDADMVWNSFIWVVERYYLAATRPRNLLDEMRAGNYPELYERFEWLYDKLFDIDRSKRPGRKRNEQPGPPRTDDYSPTLSQIKRFLQEESNLDE